MLADHIGQKLPSLIEVFLLVALVVGLTRQDQRRLPRLKTGHRLERLDRFRRVVPAVSEHDPLIFLDCRSEVLLCKLYLTHAKSGPSPDHTSRFCRRLAEQL